MNGRDKHWELSRINFPNLRITDTRLRRKKETIEKKLPLDASSLNLLYVFNQTEIEILSIKFQFPINRIILEKPTPGSRMTQFLKDRASDSEEVVTPLMPDGTYLSRNSATLGPMIRQPPCDRFLLAVWLMNDFHLYLLHSVINSVLPLLTHGSFPNSLDL